MNENVNLSPFDLDAVGMIEQVTGLVPAVFRKDGFFAIEWTVKENSNDAAIMKSEAIIEALKGRLGERFKDNTYIGTRSQNNDVSVDYMTGVYYDGQEWPTQTDYYTKTPDDEKGVLFVPKAREFKAIRFDLENVNNLVSFVGCGRVIDYTGTSTPEKTHFLFESESGLTNTAFLGDYVVKENGHFFVMPADIVNKFFEFKYQN